MNHRNLHRNRNRYGESVLSMWTGYDWPDVIYSFPPFLVFFDVILFPLVSVALALLTPCLFPFYLIIWFLFFRGEKK